MKFQCKTILKALCFCSAALSFQSCSKTEIVLPVESVSAENIFSAESSGFNFCNSSRVMLTASQTMLVGTVEIGNDANNLYVTYFTTDGWTMNEVNVKIVANRNGATVRNGYVSPSKFPYQMAFSVGVTKYTFIIPKAELTNTNNYCVFAEAIVERTYRSHTTTKTAWAGVIDRVTDGRWYGSADYFFDACDITNTQTGGTLTTYSQDDWAGANLSSYLDNNFDNAFADGLKIGSSRPGSNYFTFTSAAAIRTFIPQTGAAFALPESLTNPAFQQSALWGELVTAKLNITFDAYDADFASTDLNLLNAVFKTGAYTGKSVQEVIDIADNTIGNINASQSTLDDLATALETINTNYSGGSHDAGNLEPKEAGGIK